MRREIERVNEEVTRVLHCSDDQLQPKGRGKYEYTAEEQVQIGNYATENGPPKASRHFTKLLGRKVAEV